MSGPDLAPRALVLQDINLFMGEFCRNGTYADRSAKARPAEV